MSKIKYQAYVSGQGWQDERENGQLAGTVGEHRAIEAVRITGIETEEGANLGVAGRGLVHDMGWSTEDAVNGQDIGSTGLDKYLEAIKIGLFGNDAEQYDIWYRLHVENMGFLNFVRDFELSGTENMNLQAEAIQIFLARKDAQVWLAADTTIPAQSAPPAPPQENADTLRKKVIDLAASHIGESGTEFQARFGIQGQDWCAAFVSCIFIDAGLKDKIIMETYVPNIVSWAQRSGLWRGRNSNYQPKSGDLIIFDFNNNGVGDHVGIVHSSTGFYDTNSCEGNTGSPRQVRMQHRTSGILGYVAVPF